MGKRAIWCAAWLVACGPGGADSDSAAGAEPCETLEDAGTQEMTEGGGSGTSGILLVTLLTDESTDPHDPLYVAFRPYTLENVETGGVQQTGKTSGDGLVEETLGEGTWAFDAAYTRGSTTCLASLEVTIAAGSTTTACPLMSCPG